MKTFSKIQWLLLPVMLSGLPVAAAEPAKPAPVKPEPIRSVFIIPSSAKEGRDPFFPDSTRAYESATPKTGGVVETTSLAVKGYTVSNGHQMVIINNHSFMAGDEGDVLVPGGRVHVRCIDIKPSVVTIEVNGQRRELIF